MRPRHTPWFVLALALALVSCAGPTELARRSNVALQGGDPEKAYQLARKALDKEPQNAAAREAMNSAARTLADDWRERIRNLALSDTLGAAKLTLDFESLRSEFRAYRVTLAPDPDFDRAEVALRAAAGRIYYRLGSSDLKDGRPKRAYTRFAEATRYVAAYADLDRKMQRAWDLAQSRVVVLPVRDENAGPAFARELTDRLYEDLDSRIRSDRYRFTKLVPESEVWSVVTVRQLDRLDREAALKIARKLGADRVVWARTFGLTTDTRTDNFHGPIWKKGSVRDSSGRSVTTWTEVPFEMRSRQRTVRVQWDVEVLSADDDAVLARDRDAREAVARAVWTSFQPQGGADEYALYPSDWRDRDRERCDSIDRRWKSNCEGLTLPRFLERAKRDRSRGEYRRDYRGEFAGGSPVFLNDLPPAVDLAYIALADLWKPVDQALERLDALDDADVPVVSDDL